MNVPIEKADISIRNANQHDDFERIAELIMLSAAEYFPFIFCASFERSLTRLIAKQNNVFSFKNIVVAEKGHVIIGVSIGYDHTALSLMNTLQFIWNCMPGILLHPGRTIKCTNIIGACKAGEYYWSNVAIDAHYQNCGIFSLLFNFVEQRIIENGYRKIIGDIEVHRENVLALMEKKGYQVEMVNDLRYQKPHSKQTGDSFRFYHISKTL